MSRYQELRDNPPVLSIKPNAKEVIFDTISCMCDNSHRFKFKRQESGFKVCTGIQCINNFFDKKDMSDELTWAADEGDWKAVVKMINSGYQKIETVKSR